MTLAREGIDLAVVMPCLNDWLPVSKVLEDLDEVAANFESVHVFVVNDGSTEEPPAGFLERNYRAMCVSLVTLESNLGHQRALCTGLVNALSERSYSHVVLMDSDGEDRPSDIPLLAASLGPGKLQAAVAMRRKRQAGSAFRVLNRMFQWLFRILTGRTLNFGNFMVLTHDSAKRLTNTSDSWNNIPTSLMRSGISITRVPIDRGPRHAGDSRLGLVGLINHGLGAISVYSDVVFTRVIVASAVALIGSFGIGLAALITRFITGTPLPGWFALGTTAVAISSLVLLVTVTLLTFTMLQSRRTVTPPLSATVERYVASVESLPIEHPR